MSTRMIARALVAALLLFGSQALIAQEFRQLNRIPQPQAARLPPGARSMNVPIADGVVRMALDRVVTAWNTATLRDYLADNFPDRSRLADTLLATAPRDARLRILSVQGVQTLTQYVTPGRDRRDVLFSRVSVTARTQIEFNDPVRGFQRIEGTNEFILLLTQGL